VYIIHVKGGFDAKMRDACSQISISSEVIQSDLQNGKPVLGRYYEEWAKHAINASRNVPKEDFLSWFEENRIVYMVLASTTVDFVPISFESNILRSHIARREVIATRNEFKGRGYMFQLAHTKRL
jgi:hypothetical protein